MIRDDRKTLLQALAISLPLDENERSLTAEELWERQDHMRQVRTKAILDRWSEAPTVAITKLAEHMAFKYQVEPEYKETKVREIEMPETVHDHFLNFSKAFNQVVAENNGDLSMVWKVIEDTFGK